MIRPDPLLWQATVNLYKLLMATHYRETIANFRTDAVFPAGYNKKVRELTRFFRPVDPPPSVTEELAQAARQWITTGYEILDRHYSTCVVSSSQSLLRSSCPSWEEAWSRARIWARSDLGTELSQGVLDTVEALIPPFSTDDFSDSSGGSLQPPVLRTRRSRADFGPPAQASGPRAEPPCSPGPSLPVDYSTSLRLPPASSPRTHAPPGPLESHPTEPCDSQTVRSPNLSAMFASPTKAGVAHHVTESVRALLSAPFPPALAHTQTRQGFAPSAPGHPDPEPTPEPARRVSSLAQPPPPATAPLRPAPCPETPVRPSPPLSPSFLFDDSPALDPEPAPSTVAPSAPTRPAAGSQPDPPVSLGSDSFSSADLDHTALTVHEHGGNKANWSIIPSTKILVLGSSNLKRLPKVADRDVSLDCYPGAYVRNAIAILSSIPDPLPSVHRVILSFGLNDSSKTTVRSFDMQLRRLYRVAATKFPLAQIRIPIISFSPDLPEKVRTRLKGFNLIIANLPHLPALPPASFKVCTDLVHWSPETGLAMWSLWRSFLYG